MEEIDIIELLKRIKEGKAPKEIEINGNKYQYNESDNILFAYQSDYNMFSECITLDTKIKILDNPIIKRLGILPKISNENEIMLKDKINEIIDILNKENKDE